MSGRPLSLSRMTTALMIALPLLGGSLHARAAEPETVLKTTRSWDGTVYRSYPDSQPEITVLRYKILEHSALAWHTHPVINAAYVVSGHITVERRSDGKKRELGPGEVLAEMVDAEHRGVTGDEPVELIVFYAGTPGVPLTVKAGKQN